MKSRTLLAAALSLMMAAPLYSQGAYDAASETEREVSGAVQAMRMIMPTNDEKVFRLVRPVVAALQVKLAESGLFEGRINGLYGPSTREAVTAYQSQEGQAVTGLMSLETSLTLLGMEPTVVTRKYADRIDMQAPLEPGMHADMAAMAAPASPDAGEGRDAHADMQQMNQMQHAQSAETYSAVVGGDPADPKSLMVMSMPGMVMENRHTRAVRALRELVAAMQMKMADSDAHDGTIDGLPGSPASREALETYQRATDLEVTGQLDFPTALTLFGLVPSIVEVEYGARLEAHSSPVAADHGLMEASSRRLRSLIEWGGSPSPTRRQQTPTQAHESAADTVEIEVRLDEFSFSPDPLEIPAERPVRLVVRNVGKVSHEFMAGREPKENDFEDDLFAGVTVDIRSGEAAEMDGEHGHEAGGHDEMEGMRGMGHGDEHGTMVMVDPEKTTYMTFTLSASKRGTWSMACFVPGHFAAGMRGTLVVK